MIESRYKIEYVLPKAKRKKSRKIRLLAYVLLMLISLSLVGAIAYGFSSKNLSLETAALFQKVKNNIFGFNNHQVNIDSNDNEFTTTEKTTQDTEEDISSDSDNIVEEINLPEDVVIETEKIKQQPAPEGERNSPTTIVENNTSNNQAIKEIEALLIKNKEQLQTSEKQLAENAVLTQNINGLSEQLKNEKNRNISLNKQLSDQKEDREILTDLLNEALRSANKEDKNYISELNSEIDKNSTPFDTKNPVANRDLANKAKQEVAKEAPKDSSDKTTDYNNRVSLPKTSQVDAIIATMKGVKTGPQNKSVSLHKKLQQQINQLIKDDDTKTGILYKKALEVESQTRKNEMRSIVVKKGETLWSIALRVYGDGNHYKKIIKANPHLTEKNRTFLTEGQIIRVPI